MPGNPALLKAIMFDSLISINFMLIVLLCIGVLVFAVNLIASLTSLVLAIYIRFRKI